MFDPALFRQIASETIPESLYQQLEAHLEDLSRRYADVELVQAQTDEIAHMYFLDRLRRFEEIRKQFEKEREPNWPAFAREHWPEIDTHFNLGPKDESGLDGSTQYISPENDIPF